MGIKPFSKYINLLNLALITLRRIEYHICIDGFEYANPKWMVGIFLNKITSIL